MTIRFWEEHWSATLSSFLKRSLITKGECREIRECYIFSVNDLEVFL